MRHLLTSLFLLLAAASSAAQPLSPEQSGGVYYAYPVAEAVRVAVPEGYEPFFISHYGRHGSRWVTTQERYDWVMQHFVQKENLTPLGRSAKKRLERICRNARGRAGQLTPLGARQHRQIARRMAQNYPEVFAAGARVWARSSTVPRCQASMQAFCQELQRRVPALPAIEALTHPAFMAWINHESAELRQLSTRTQRQPACSPGRLMASLFVDTTAIDNPLKLLCELHFLASDMQDVPLNVSLWDLFTQEEMEAVYNANNERMTLCHGDTLCNDGIPARSNMALWQQMEHEADSVVAAHGRGASLRFGHDTALFRLLTLLQLPLPGRGMDQILPMAANMQMIFVRNALDSVQVGILLNERLALPFQPWSQLRQHMHQRMHQLEHQRQLASLNTMVGTAQANTRSAGLFGKGSEEKGQTLPAVLVPNGQTFWTPQTRATERKCVAPYYYADTLLQGIRASHWLVGGCTQDYGSFTVMPTTTLPTAEADGGRPFSHADETSHPHYYAVTLPTEGLRLELTALSHAAVMRLTPQADGPVSVSIVANSDEQQGGVSLDAARRQATGFNPVHRIYQGWGEPAGFSGHFVLQYADELLAADSSQAQRLVLTFQGRAGRPIVLRMATSFTNAQGAWRNLLSEVGGLTFEQVEQRCLQRWTERLHTIDVSDPDTALVNQFYGALYRASFLPREMSDADGSYVRFSSRDSVACHPGTVRYGDFSMWDTYRALHPLYHIIVPHTSAQMMQSLVDMYREGGWLPIFPCWNSYTAAMIGDHCTAALADAYVKGIRDFDAQAAYEGMRQNAFQLPATYEDYCNGLGRRALSSYMKYGYIPLEDSVKEAFHQQEQTSRTLEYAFDDFCLAQMAQALGHDPGELLRRAENWRNVINPLTGYADGRHADGRWLNNRDVVHRQPYITEGATCHYTWYVPHNIPGLIAVLGGREAFVAKLDSMFTQGRYWHGNEPCHQVAWLYSLAGQPTTTAARVAHILQTEYNDTPGGLSGNDDAGQMSAWQLFAMMGFYPVCPATPTYALGGAYLQQVTLNLPSGNTFTIRRSPGGEMLLDGQPLSHPELHHSSLLQGGELLLP